MNDDQRRSGEQPPTPDEQASRPSTPEGQLARELASVDDPWLLDRVVSGEAGGEWASITELLNAAAGPAQPREVQGEQEAVASFLAARRAGVTRTSGRRARGAGRAAAVSTLLAGKFAAVTVAGVVTLGAGGMAAAAYSGILPAPLQDVAHRTIGAPLPGRDEVVPTTAPTATPTVTHQGPATSTTSSTTAPRTRPSTTAPASTTVAPPPARPVAELCAAWRQQLLPTSAPGYLQLTHAAGSSSLDAFCSLTPSSPTQSPTSTPTAEPTATPSDTAPPTDSPSTPPVTASDQPTTPMKAPDQPAPTTQGTDSELTG